LYAANQDEWLITPTIEVEDGMNLSYYLFYQPFYLFSVDNVDWDTMEYEGDKVQVCNFQAYIRLEGHEEWTLLQDIADKYKDATALELLTEAHTELEKQTINIEEYAGKKVQFAFRYTTTDDGDSMFLDAVRVGVPTLENVSYELPFSTFYWGMDENFTGMSVDVAQVPVFQPITFMNMSDDDATFTWHYTDPQTGLEATSDDQYELELTYEPDYSSADRIENNLYTAPTLSATAPGKASAEYKLDIFIKAGGKSSLTEDGASYDLSIFPFALNKSPLGKITVFDDEIGDMAIPVFGHNANTNQYWLNYTANGDDDPNLADCYNHLEGIANLYMPELGSTLVVNGIKVFGYGHLAADAEVKFTIYALKGLFDEDGDFMGVSNAYEDLKPIATATAKGSDVIYYMSEDDQKDDLCIPFTFDAPAVLTTTEEYPAFFFMLEGFNSDKVEYFAPYQTVGNDETFSLSYMLSHVDFEVATGRPAYYNIKPIVYKEYGDYVDPISTFAFGLDAVFPWLTTETNEITLTAENASAEVALGSYYDGSELTVTAPAGIEATVAGRYDKCVLTVTRTGNFDKEIEGTVTVSGPGVEVEIEVFADQTSGIDEITNGSAEATDSYDIFGRRVENPCTGVYIVKYNEGTVSKKVIFE
ncbi:MAG: choice-of-anchor J domain-containing protein, partial [Muribaculaceae bacterium]|nr:choice-of-anchor J domain-containing protein [Muribaculaceae bacterium]